MPDYLQKYMPLLLCTVLIAAIGHASANHARAAADLKTFPSKTLAVPEKDALVDYLGLDSAKQQFAVEDISADLVLVEIFSMYCPICQAEASEVNELFSLIQEQGLDGRIKIMGIAPGNSAFEVGVFEKEYEIAFPLFPDPDYEWHELLGKVNTPFFILVNTDDSAVLATHKGAFSSPEQFFEELKNELPAD
ncbi:MAG: peroxiredoxin family protein [Desulfonatronovibrionaceae bacterium]